MRGSLVAAALATLAHPRWWLIALAGFLLRGGVVVVALPIIALPTVASLMGLLAPTIVGQVITGAPGAPVAVLVLATAIILSAFLGLGAWLGTAFDASLAGEFVTDGDLDLEAASGLEDGPGLEDASRPPGLGAARLGPHVLTGLAFVFAASRLFAVAYREATTPGAPTTPFVVRVVQGAPEAVVVLVVAWLVAEAVGGLAMRELLFHRSSEPGPAPSAWSSIRRGIRDLATVRGVATLVLVNVGVIVIAAPGWLAAARAWNGLRILLSEGATELELGAGLGLFVAVALGGAVLLAVGLAWRSSIWTAFVTGARRHADPGHGVERVTLGLE